MSRPLKKKIDFTDDALKGLLQNIWSEAEETGTKATYQYGKQNRDIKDNADIAMVSKINAEYLKIRSSTTETKLSIARLIKDIVYKDTNGNQKTNENTKLDEGDKAMIYELIKKESAKENIEFIKESEKKLFNDSK